MRERVDKAKCDFHIHTEHLKCANETMTVKNVVKQYETLGLSKIAFTDHLDNFESAEKHLLISHDICELDTNLDVYFGVELNFMSCDGKLAYNEEIKERIGFQFAIGGIHSSYVDEYDIKKMIDIQHRHHIRICQNPLVSILVHPYWFSIREFLENDWPKVHPLKYVPENHIKELAQISGETNTAIELNSISCLQATFFGEDAPEIYEEYIMKLAEEGAVFSFGSDAHDIGQLDSISSCFNLADKLSLEKERIWQPDFEPLNRLNKQL